jgi:molybdate transport system substrate-binding protein
MYIQKHTRFAIPFVVAATLFISTCSTPTPAPEADPTTIATELPLPGAVTTPKEPCSPQTVNVFAAASLTEAFKEMAPLFQAKETCAELVFNFAGSQKLSQQILDGAPADVFASASGKNMDEVKSAGLVSDAGSRIFARTDSGIAVQTSSNTCANAAASAGLES